MKTLRILGLALVAAMLCTASGLAAPGGCTNAPWLVPFAFETITVSSSAIGFTATVYQPAGSIAPDMAVVTTETNDMRYRSDGINPTASVGHVLASAGTLTVCGAQSIKQVRFIRVSADGTAQVTYYRQGNN